MLTQADFNAQVYDLLQTDQPFMVSHFGSNEIMNMIEHLAVKYGVKKHMNPRLVSQLNINAGVFPAGEEMAGRFAEYMLQYVPEIDFLGAWFRNMEDYILTYYAKEAKPVRLKYLEPYTSETPWSKGLAGKKCWSSILLKTRSESNTRRKICCLKTPMCFPTSNCSR